MNKVKPKKGQSSLIAFLIAIILILLILIPTYYLITDVSKPSAKPIDFAQVIKNQINGGSVLIFFNSTANSPNITLLVLSGNANFTLADVYVVYHGIFVNITKYVYAVKITPTSKTIIGPLPKPIIYDFTAYSTITLQGVEIPIWNATLILEINAYNQTVFATVYPNSAAFS